MNTKRIGLQTVCLPNPPVILSGASVVGQKEGHGPLAAAFDRISEDAYFGQKTWEKAESAMQKQAFQLALNKAGLTASQLQYLISGDLLNQCTASAFAHRDTGVPFWGLYGACSTMSEGLGLAAMLIDGGYAQNVCAMTSSHFCSAERQFRQPLEYGGQRTPTAQWTATAAGAVILSDSGLGPRVTHVTTGKMIDAGIKDANNMGAAMAKAAYDTIHAHLTDLGQLPEWYDLIVTGDLGSIGRQIVLDFFQQDGFDLSSRYEDCGTLLFDAEEQDIHAGGSGCGCSAAVLCSWLLSGLQSQRWKRILFCGTGALMSPTSSGQGESIPGICHAVALSSD